jgi:ubiquinone/menaquinone biosynthesis C-methylase UbiE
MHLSDKSNRNTQKVRYLFDQMAEEYDDLRDLWYSWLFSRLHFLIAKNVLTEWIDLKNDVLDIGCGTGFQSYLYAITGARVTGIDIAQELLTVAREKGVTFRGRFPISLFPSHFDFVTEYDRKISDILQPRFGSAEITIPTFRNCDAIDLPFDNNSFDHINCCGSTLNYIDNHNEAIAEMARVLRPGGSYVIEVDAKYNLDLLWPILDSTVLRGRLGYEVTTKEALHSLFSGLRSHITIDYPFGEINNPVYMDLKLFEKRTLLKELKTFGLSCYRTESIHSITNLIPSTILDTAKPSGPLKGAFDVLANIEANIPFYLPGCSLVVFGTKQCVAQ